MASSGIEKVVVVYRSRSAITVFSILSILLLGVYYFRALSLGYFFRRIGSAEAAQLFSSLSGLDLLLIKFHDMAVPPIFFMLIVVLRQQWSPLWMKIIGAILAVDVLIFAVVNSRIALVFIFVSVGVMMLWTGLELKKFVLRMLALFPVFLYLMIVLVNFRASVDAGGVDYLAILNPFMTRAGGGQISAHEWLDRVNCFDLISIISPVLQERGFPLGEAWYSPFISLFGPLVGSTEAITLKAIGMTTAKAFMIGEYTNLSAVDYQSCGLTDAYGNFGPVGFILAGFVHGVFLGLITRLLMHGRSGRTLLVVIMLSYYFLLFEQEFFNFAIGWIRIVPWLIVLAMLAPIRYYSVVGSRSEPPEKTTVSAG